MTAARATTAKPVWTIICSDTPGLRNDALLLASSLRGNDLVSVRVVVCSTSFINRMAQWLVHLFLQRTPYRAETVVFLEDVRPAWMKLFRHRVLVPNLEWIRPSTEAHIEKLDRIWCKSRHAEEILRSKGLDAVYLGFTSVDRYMPTVPKDYSRCFHLQGRSMQKGTLDLLNVWSQNPDWPLLEVVSRDRSLARYTAANIRFHFDFMTEDALATLMNQCGIHICASTVEGFGHSINESMSCSAAVITTDGAPMNELVSTGQGVLVPVSGAIPVGWGQAFQVEAHALSAAITGVLNMDIERLAQMGHGARAQYLRSQESFHHNVKKLFTETRLG